MPGYRRHLSQWIESDTEIRLTLVLRTPDNQTTYPGSGWLVVPKPQPPLPPLTPRQLADAVEKACVDIAENGLFLPKEKDLTPVDMDKATSLDMNSTQLRYPMAVALRQRAQARNVADYPGLGRRP